MDLREFRRAGHLPTLLCAFLYFTISCMVWMMVGALANSIIPDLGELSGSQKGLLVAVPVLGGALLRLVLGPLADHIGAKKTALIGLALTPSDRSAWMSEAFRAEFSRIDYGPEAAPKRLAQPADEIRAGLKHNASQR